VIGLAVEMFERCEEEGAIPNQRPARRPADNLLLEPRPVDWRHREFRRSGRGVPAVVAVIVESAGGERVRPGSGHDVDDGPRRLTVLRGKAVGRHHELSDRLQRHDSPHHAREGIVVTQSVDQNRVVAARLRGCGKPGEIGRRASSLVEVGKNAGVSVASVLKSRPGTGSASMSPVVNVRPSAVFVGSIPATRDVSTVTTSLTEATLSTVSILASSPTVRVISVCTAGANPSRVSRSR
jgi:hypothetical protein